MEIIISGSECEDKLIFFDTVQQAAMELGLDASIIKLDENAYPEISMPRLQIDGRILWSGRLLALAEAKDIFS